MIPDLEPIEIGLIQRIHSLRSLWGNAKLPTPTLAAIAAPMAALRIPAGTVLAKEGEPIGRAYFVVEGEITSSRDGKVVDTFGPSAVIGVLALLARVAPDARGFDYVATRDSVALVLRAEDLLEMFEDHFELMHAALRQMAGDAVLLRSRLSADAGFSTKPQRASVECPAHPLDLVERLLYLRQTFGFHDSHIDALAEFARAAIEVRYAAGTRLWSVGDRSQHLLVVISGICSARTPDGKRFQFGPGDMFGSLDLIAGIPRWFDVDVRDDVVALSLDGDLLVDLWEDQPELGFDFLRLLATMLMSLRQRIVDREAVAPAA